MAIYIGNKQIAGGGVQLNPQVSKTGYLTALTGNSLSEQNLMIGPYDKPNYGIINRIGQEYTESGNFNYGSTGCWIDFYYTDDGANNYIQLCSGDDASHVTTLEINKDNRISNYPFLTLSYFNPSTGEPNKWNITGTRRLSTNNWVAVNLPFTPNTVYTYSGTDASLTVIILDTMWNIGDITTLNTRGNTKINFKVGNNVRVRYADGYDTITGTTGDIMSYCVMCFDTSAFLINKQVYR